MIGIDHLAGLADQADLSAEDAVIGLLRFTIGRCVDDPEGVSIAQVASVIESTARFMQHGGKSQDGGLAALMTQLKDAPAT